MALSMAACAETKTGKQNTFVPTEANTKATADEATGTYDEDGYLKVDVAPNPDYTVVLQEKLKAFLYDTYDGFLNTQKDNNHQYFAEGFSLFRNDRCFRAIEFSNAGFSYSILPVPKYDEAQAEHITIMGISSRFTESRVTARIPIARYL